MCHTHVGLTAVLPGEFVLAGSPLSSPHMWNRDKRNSVLATINFISASADEINNNKEDLTRNNSYLLNMWLSTRIFVKALKSSGMSITGRLT